MMNRRIEREKADPVRTGSVVGLQSTGRGAAPRPVAFPASRRSLPANAALSETGALAGMTLPAFRGNASGHRLSPMNETGANITELLRLAAAGSDADTDALIAAIYPDLRRIAGNQLRSERSDHTLQPTALVHEAWMRLIDQHSVDWKSRAHFFSVAARVFRRILVDHARSRQAARRGGGKDRKGIDAASIPAPDSNPDLVELDGALDELAQLDPRQATIVEMKFFGGMTLDEIARFLEMGRRSVDREWAAARAWLYVRLSGESGRIQA